MFSRFDTVLACDGRTDRRTDAQTDVQPVTITCFSIADARKNYCACLFFLVQCTVTIVHSESYKSYGVLERLVMNSTKP